MKKKVSGMFAMNKTAAIFAIPFEEKDKIIKKHCR